MYPSSDCITHTHVGYLKCYPHDIRRDKGSETVWSTDVGLHVRHSVLCSALMAVVWRLAGFLQMTSGLTVTSEQAQKLISDSRAREVDVKR